MLKTLHLVLALTAVSSFIGRIILAETQPELVKLKTVKIAAHGIDSLLLASGIALAVYGSWVAAGHGWLAAKLLALVAYIGFGIVAMRGSGHRRWLAFAAALVCFAYIGIVAVTKNPWFFW